MNYEDLPDDTVLETAKPDPNAIAIRTNVAKIESALTEFDRISAGLADLAARYPVDLVYDVSTGKGMAEAIAHRAAWRDPRINVEKFRKTAKAPVLALGKDIDARAAWLTEQLLIGETPVDDQIKAEEQRKEAAKQARIAAEFGRVQAIQDSIGEIHMDVMAVSSKSSDHIRVTLDAMRAMELDPLVYQELMHQAKAARDAAIIKLETALKAKLHDEAQAAQLAAERAELAALRAAAAEQKRKDEAAAAEAARVERERAAAEAQKAREERARLDTEAAAARAEQDRLAAEERAKAQAAHDASMKAEREAAAEAKRLADEKAAKAIAKQRKTEAAEKKLRDAAPQLLHALREVRPHVAHNDHALVVIDRAIEAAT